MARRPENEAYGKISTDYKGISIGYDNAREENGGTGWLGLAVSYADGDISLPGGGGTAKAYDLSLYKTWLGKHGHYYDLIARYGRMQDEYHTTDISRHCSEADYAANMLRIGGIRIQERTEQRMVCTAAGRSSLAEPGKHRLYCEQRDGS